MTDVRRRRQFLATALAVALALLAFLSYRAGTDRYDPEGESGDRVAREAVVQRARALTAQAMSYDSTSGASEIAAVERNMTPDMRVAYERTLPSPAERDKADGTGAKVVAKVVRAGLISLTKDEASVLVFVNQQASAKSTKKVLESPTWQVVHLVRDEDNRRGQWLLSGMDAP